MKKITLFLIALFSMCNVNAKTYQVEQVTSEDQFDNSTINDYIIVNQADNGHYYAWSSTLLSGTNSKRAQAKENAELVTFNEDFTELTVESDNNILWTFGISAKSISQGLDRVTLVSREDVYSGSDSNRNQIAFSSTDTATNPAGLTYTNDAYALDFKFLNDEGNVRIIYKDVKNNRTYYVRFLSTDNRFLAGDLGKASKKIKIYKVTNKYNKVEGFKTQKPSELNFSKEKEQDSTFEKTGVYKVDLTMKSIPQYKDTDVVLVLDISNSVDFDNKMIQLKENASHLAESILNMNNNNRVGVIKFADGTLLEEESYELGMTKNIDEIKDFINLDVADKLGGTNYTSAFDSTYSLLQNYEEKGREQLVIFITDGAPTIYNKTKFSVFKNTDDGVVGAYATNWSNYFLNNKLGNLEKMKEAGISVFTIGVNIDEDMAIKSDGSFVVKSTSAIKLLKSMATTEEYFFQVNDYNNLTETFDEIYDSLISYLTNVKVNDSITTNYELVTQKYENKIPYIEINNENLGCIEKIEFNNTGTEAYSSLNPEQNILIKKDSGTILEATYFKYDFRTKKLTWNVDKVTTDELNLTYFIKPVKTQETYKEDPLAINSDVKIEYVDNNIINQEMIILSEKTEKNPNTSSKGLILACAAIMVNLVVLSKTLKKYKWLKI